MNEFYITLPIDSSLEFTDNQANHFKVRLPQQIPLDREGWKVAIASTSLPRMSLFQELHGTKKFNRNVL